MVHANNIVNLVVDVLRKVSKITLFVIAIGAKAILYNIMNKQITNVVLEYVLINLPYFAFGMVLKEMNSNINIFLHKQTFAKTIILKIKHLVDCKLFRYLNDKLIFLGKYSFLIYLIHMPVAGLISNLFSRSSILLYFVLVQPIIVAGVVEQMIKLLRVISERIPHISIIIGMPNEMIRRQE